jgi:hypothetical protein
MDAQCCVNTANEIIKRLESKPKYDSVVTSVIDAFKRRADFGQQKYGTTLDRTDLGFLDWVQHAQEELMDAILYLEKLKSLPTPGATES